MEDLKGKTVFITGGSRGIGLEIAKKLAEHGANITIAAKTATPHPKLPGTIYTAAEEIEAAGGKALPIVMDVREESQISKAIEDTVEKFGGLDILINNASAINLMSISEINSKSVDLMFNINIRGTLLTAQKSIPYLANSSNPHILTLSPPIDLSTKWFNQHTPYSIAKYGMSMCTIGLSEELKEKGIAANSLWPKTTIKTAAVQNLLGGEKLMKISRDAKIVSDAAYHIVRRDSRKHTGNFYIDEEVLREEGIDDFSAYSEVPEGMLMIDLFLEREK